MKVLNKMIKELKAKGWKVNKSGPFIEASKGHVFSMLSESAVTCTVEPLRPGSSMFPMSRIVKERVFLVPDEESAASLTPEERELRDVVLEATKP